MNTRKRIEPYLCSKIVDTDAWCIRPATWCGCWNEKNELCGGKFVAIFNTKEDAELICWQLNEAYKLSHQKGYCELKEKCDDGLCDCTNEEYDGMVQSNIKLSLENDKLKNIIAKALNKVQYIIDYGFDYDGFNSVDSLKGLIDLLVDLAKQTRRILKSSEHKKKG